MQTATRKDRMNVALLLILVMFLTFLVPLVALEVR